MIKFSHKTLSEFVSEKAVGLSGYLKTIASGKPDTPRTPLYSDISDLDILAAWKQILLASNVSSNPTLLNFELSKIEKWGPQGGFPPFEERLEELSVYGTTRPNDWYLKLISRSFPLSDGSNGSLFDWLYDQSSLLFGQLRDLRPRSYPGLINFMASKHKLDTNSGVPDFSRRKREDVWQRAIRDAASGKWREYPAVIGSRSSRGKTRFIFMFPMSTNLVEASFTYELQNALMRNRENNISHPGNIFAAWRGFDAVERVMKLQYETVDTTSDKRHILLGIDYTKMDTTVRPNHSEILFHLLKPRFQRKYHASLYESLMHVHYIPVLVGETRKKGVLFTDVHGYASGSGWTNFGESLLSYLLHEYFKIRWFEEFGELISFGVNQVNGDDGVLSFLTSIDDDRIANFAVQVMTEFGFDANVEKQEVSTDFTIYLQRLFLISEINSQYWPGIYPSIQALNTMVHPERYHDPDMWNERMETLRWIMILENCNRHPLFNSLIRFVMKGDRLSLGLRDPEGFRKFLNYVEETSKTAHSLNPTYNRYSYGLRSFHVIRVLQSSVGNVTR